MKFINYLTSISGVEVYPMISLMMFVLFFSALILYVWKSDKKHIQTMSQLPLENNSQDLNSFNHD
jgi:cbb3-type cytochrome oxidase subunit 3